jgi:hypothetical protein
MSDFKFICPHCHRHIECDTRLEGNRLKCPACRAAIVVPSAAGAGSVPPVAGRVRSRRSLMVAVTLAVALVVAAGGFGLLKFLLHPRVLRPDAWVKVDESAAGGLSGWGRPANPDGDCDFFVQPDAVMIKVPGSATAHDLAMRPACFSRSAAILPCRCAWMAGLRRGWPPPWRAGRPITARAWSSLPTRAMS